MPIRLSEENPLVELWEEGEGVHLDVRPLLFEGGEPFPYIMEVLDQLSSDELLILHTPFEPLPLYRVLQKRGFTFQVEKENEEHFRIHIRRAEATPKPS